MRSTCGTVLRWYSLPFLIIQYKALCQGIANSHLDRALDLAFHAHGIKRLADVVDCRVIQYLYTAVFHIHLDLGKMGSVGYGHGAGGKCVRAADISAMGLLLHI